MFSLAAVFGSLGACRPSVPMRYRAQPDSAALVHAGPTGSADAFPDAGLSFGTDEYRALRHRTRTRRRDPRQPLEADRPSPRLECNRDPSHRDRPGQRGEHSRSPPRREWLGIGYHFVIGNGNGMPDGEIEPTFRWREQLHGADAGADEYNQHGIGIAFIGNFEKEPPTPAQLASIKQLVAVLKSEYHIDGERIIGHREVKATACPGKLFPIAEVREVTVVRKSQRSASLADLSGSRLQ